MNYNNLISKSIITVMAVLLVFTLTLALTNNGVWARETVKRTTQTSFQTPEQAVDALLQALKDNNEMELMQIFGSQYKDVISSPDKKLDQTNRMKFYDMAQQAKRLVPASGGRMVLVVGSMSWPFPIPLVKGANGWHFDTATGKEEIINRRVGENELAVISLMDEYVKAQKEYASQDRGSGIKEYAQRIQSTSGKKNGLYWDIGRNSGEEMSPLGPLVARSEDYLGKNRVQGKTPFHGYFFKILTRQGSAAPGGRMNYIVNGHMTKGFAMIAYPAAYGNSGVMTFIVNQDGKIYEKNLGPDTLRIAEAITEYNPDKTWRISRD